MSFPVSLQAVRSRGAVWVHWCSSRRHVCTFQTVALKTVSLDCPSFSHRSQQRWTHCRSPLPACCSTALNLSCCIFGFLCYSSLAGILTDNKGPSREKGCFRNHKETEISNIDLLRSDGGQPGNRMCPEMPWPTLYQISKRKIPNFHPK